MIDWLVGTLIATSALMALVLAIREPVRRQFGPTVAYALWLLPAARMILPSFTRTVERVTPAGAMPNLPPAATIPATPADAAASGFAAQLGGWPAILIAVWLSGAAILLARGISIYVAQRRAILGDGVQLARIGDIRLVRSERVRGPLAFGIVDRVVIVPLDFDQRFSERQRRLALDHELAHHRSGDLVARLIAFVLLCLQWFNPLAWAAHAAFRFDQEAACDARVLDQADAADRPSYGEAIAKAASGWTLLFAGALDRPSTLSRRLTIMTRVTSSRSRRFGFFLISGGMLLGLPLTATWAVDYVDVPRTTHHAARGQPVTLPGGVTLGRDDIAFFTNDSVIIHGQTKRLDQLTRAERSELRAVIAKSRRELQAERAELPARLAEMRREADRIRSGAYKRELLADREDLRRDLAEADSEAAELRAEGRDPEKMKAEIRESLREAEATDIDKEAREELAELNPDTIIAELRSDEQQMIRMQARLDQLDRADN